MAFSKVPIGISALLSALSAFLIGISIGILPSAHRHFSDRARAGTSVFSVLDILFFL